MRPNSISAFFPAYNDGGTIPSMVITALRTLATVTDDYEVVVVNDGSADYTAEVLEELARVYPQVRIIHHPINRGYGAALRTGFANAQKEWVFYTDGDAQYDPHELKLLVDALAPGVDIVNGYKIVRHDPLHRILIGRLYHHFVKFMFGFKLRDVDCDFRLIRRDALDAVPLESDTGTICLEMIKKFQDKGYKFAEVPVHHFHRAYGKSQFFNFPRLWRTGIQLTQLWWKLVVRREHLKSGAENVTRI
ncbi:MAG: glycosyltransferase family 2 protein [Chloroflexota bacterium]